MSAPNPPGRLNRGLLALLGLLLAAAGGLILATHFGWRAVVDPAGTVVPGTGRPPTWALYVITAVAVLVGLLCLRWLAAQLVRKPRSRVWRLENDPARGRTELATTTAVEPFTEEIETYPDVAAADAVLTGTPHDAALTVVIHAEQRASPTEIRQRLSTETLPRLRQALDLQELPTAVEFRFTGTTTTTVR
ncbi:hypothetical protein L1857_22705 [Amycolatopsis thermalba]|uniref:Alkaline shock response membrane anchor protein AmaP n=1 Tax=Amycolatopsis thermalba TaxID=944492 RepID=A0ABY4NZ97_9PSEU|nr:MULTISPECIES: alkaline shock response membrane anchor protein AmaP [Amycolatopsis]UQS25414.1 hypothetical protein L1857_22705 [Amycolatopsis thermalba]